MNQSISECVVPVTLKSASVIPLIQISQFRSKSHEGQLFEHHSTETALIKISNDILCEMDDGKSFLMVMLDQSAAFDTVNLEILLHRLEDTFGISGSAL